MERGDLSDSQNSPKSLADVIKNPVFVAGDEDDGEIKQNHVDIFPFAN